MGFLLGLVVGAGVVILAGQGSGSLTVSAQRGNAYSPTGQSFRRA